MISVGIETNKDDLKFIDNMHKDLRGFIISGMRKGMFYAESVAKRSFGERGKPKVRTGHLRRSVESGVYNRSNEIIGWIGSDLLYARIHELGGIIRAKNVDYLKFVIEGQFVFVKQVVIPARPYLHPAVHENQEKIDNLVMEEVQRGFLEVV